MNTPTPTNCSGKASIKLLKKSVKKLLKLSLKQKIITMSYSKTKLLIYYIII